MAHLTKNQHALICQEVDLPQGRRIVLLDVGGRSDIALDEHNRNIYCIGRDGEIFWQVQAIEPDVERDSFAFICVNKKGEICADRFFGNEFVIDSMTGVANHIGWHK